MILEGKDKNEKFSQGGLKTSPFFRNYGSTGVVLAKSPLLSPNANRFQRRQQPTMIAETNNGNLAVIRAVSTTVPKEVKSTKIFRQPQGSNPFDNEWVNSSKSPVTIFSTSPGKVTSPPSEEVTKLLDEAECIDRQNHSKHAAVTVLESLNFCNLIAALYFPIMLSILASFLVVQFCQDKISFVQSSSQSCSSKDLSTNFICINHKDLVSSTVSIHSSIHLYGYTRYILNYDVEINALCNATTLSTWTNKGTPLKLDLFSYAKLVSMNTCNSFALNNFSTDQNFAEKNPFIHVNVPVSLIDWSDIHNVKSSWLNISIPRSQSSSIFFSCVVIENTHNLSKAYIRIISCFSVVAFITTVMGAIYYTYVTVYHALNLRRIFKLADTRIDVAESRLDRVRGVLDLILPEQYNAVWMLIFLAFWLNPYGSSIASIYDEDNYSKLRPQLAVAGILQLSAGFGLLSCVIWFFNGLGLDTEDDSTFGVSSVRDIKQNLRQIPFSETPFPMKSVSPTSVEFSTSSYGNGYYKDTDEKFWMKRHSVRNKEDIYGKPSRWLSSTHIEYCSPLPPHHPCSISFIDFTMRQFLFLLLTWIVCCIYWNVRLISGQGWLHFRPAMEICDYTVGSLSCVWILLLVRAFCSAQVRLNRIPYLKSRFRKILFRAIILQVYSFMLAFLLLVYYHLSVRENIYENFEPASLIQVVEYHLIWFERFFGGVFGALLPQYPLLFPLLVNPAFTVAITSAVYTFALFLHPPFNEMTMDTKLSESLESSNSAQDKIVSFYQFFGIQRGYDSHSFIALENMAHPKPLYIHNERKCRNYAKKLNQYYSLNQRSKMAKLYSKFMLSTKRKQDIFCLETACWLLEASYQAYAEVMSDNPPTVDDIESAAIATTKPTTTNPFVTEPSTTNPFDSKFSAHDKLNDRISSLGLELLSTFSSEETNTFGYIASCLPDVPHHSRNSKNNNDKAQQTVSDRVVVSFRGSVAANILGTNMYIAQIHLPPLQRNSAFFVELMKDNLDHGKCHEDYMDIKVIDKSEIMEFEVGFEELEFKSNQFYEEMSTDSSILSIPSSNPSSPIRYQEHIGSLRNSVSLSAGVLDSQGIELRPVTSDAQVVLQDKNINSSEFSSRSVDSNDSAFCSDADNIDPLVPTITKVDTADDGGVGESGTCNAVTRACISWVSTVPVLRQNFARVHSGFWHAYASIRESFMAAVVRHIYAHRRQHLLGGTLAGDVQPLTIALCGHSLGAAISLLAAYDLAENMQNIMEAFFLLDLYGDTAATMDDCVKDINRAKDIYKTQLHRWQIPILTVYTYGCPRVGNSQLARQILNKVGAVYRIAVNSDIVTMIPKLPLVYAHTGIPVTLDADSPGSMIVNPTIIERSFLRKSTGTIVNHSLDVYRSCLVSCFESKELREYRRREYLSQRKCANSSSRNENIPEWLTGT